MVLVNRIQQPKRHMSCPGIGGEQSNPSFSCAMGDDDSCSVSTISSHKSANSSFNGSFSLLDTTSSGHKRRSSLLGNSIKEVGDTLLPSTFNNLQQPVKKMKALPRWLLPLMYAMTVLSWTRVIQYRSTSYELIAGMDIEIESLRAQKDQTLKLWKEARKNHNAIMKQQKSLQKTQRLFHHEKRMIEELFEADSNSSSNVEQAEIPPETMEKFKNRKSAGVTSSWIEHRRDTLLHKIYNLQAYIKEESLKNVLEKYGPGPYNVHFHVSSREGRKPGNFIVELAPLDLMPHSIEAFLDMVTNKIWDNTVFYHHLTQDHVVAAAPVTYGTFNSKQHDFVSLGYSGVSFPEYSKHYPHKQYTMGFAGNGPNFYINTIDNTDHHGPGGQGHHDLATDADPCFGKIISGIDVIAKDMMIGRHKGKNPTGWEDFDLSRIVSVTLMK